MRKIIYEKTESSLVDVQKPKPKEKQPKNAINTNNNTATTINSNAIGTDSPVAFVKEK